MSLSGKKTYIVAIGGILLAIGGAMHGDYSVPQAAQLIMTALLGAALRHGVDSSK